MPIYEFTCKKCKEDFELLFRSRDEKVVIECPKCGSKKAERKMSVFAGKGGSCGSCSSSSCSSCGGH